MRVLAGNRRASAFKKSGILQQPTQPLLPRSENLTDPSRGNISIRQNTTPQLGRQADLKYDLHQAGSNLACARALFRFGGLRAPMAEDA
jgi:hypothetical protein